MQESRVGWWIALLISVAAAIAFFALWMIRGGEMTDLEKRLVAAREEVETLGRGATEAAESAGRARELLSGAETRGKALEREIQAEKERADRAEREAEINSRASAELERERARAADLEKGMAADLAREKARVAAVESELAAERDKVSVAVKRTETSLSSMRRLWDEEKVKLGADLASAESALKAARGELAAKAREAEARLAEARSAAAGEKRDLLAEIKRMESEAKELRDRLDSAERTETAGGAETAVLRAEWRNERERLQADIERAAATEKALRADLAELRAERQKDRAQLETGLERAVRAEETARVDMDGLRAEWQREREGLQADIAAAAATEKALRADLAGLRAEWQKERTQLRADLERLVKGEKAPRVDPEEIRAEWREERARLQADVERLSRAEGSCRAELEKASARGDGQLEEIAGLKADLEEARRQLKEVMVELALKTAPPKSSPRRFAGPVVGEVVENDGQVFIVNVGMNQKVRPGMRFDVYRNEGGDDRELGMIRILRVLADESMAVSAARKAPAMTCPATGFPVFEYGAKYSPFAVGPGGRALELVRAAPAAGDAESPAPKDLLVNPFYAPDRQKTFLAAIDVCRQRPDIGAVIESVGGALRTRLDKTVDFLIVPDGPVENDGDRVMVETAQKLGVPAVTVSEFLRYAP